MTAKLLTLVHSKIALAVIGVLLAGGSGAAVVAANHGQIPFTQSNTTSTHTSDSHANTNDHAHTVSINGKLTAYNATAKTIAVQEKDATTSTTVSVDAKTNVNGEHATSLTDLTSAVGHDVQVQADKQSDGTLLAWKITVQGADSGSSHSSGSGSENGQQHQLAGTVVSVGTGSFTIKLADGTSKTVTVSSSTQYVGASHGFSDLKAGMHVTVQGTDQSNGTFAASQIAAGGE
ncbi:MAG TPA: DUF5666 domain-containing protein [Ktedonobacterales bacterium]|nr:DUF5666 domain-containing protein [Ktedonobacterales bacterium]